MKARSLRSTPTSYGGEKRSPATRSSCLPQLSCATYFNGSFWRFIVVPAYGGFSRHDKIRFAGLECYKASVLATDPSATTATAALLHRLHHMIALHGVMENCRGIAGNFVVDEAATLLSLPRDLCIGERVLVMVTASTRARFYLPHPHSDFSYLHQTNVSILLPGSSEFSSLLSFSYSARVSSEAVEEEPFDIGRPPPL